MPEGSDNTRVGIVFTPEGADSVIRSAQNIKREVEGIADAAAKVVKSGGIGGKAPPAAASEEVRRIRDRRKEHQEDLEDLKKTAKYRELTAQEERRRLAITRAIRRNESLEARQLKREENQQTKELDKQTMGEQKLHVQWITRALQAVGLGKYLPNGQVGSSILSALGPAAAGGMIGGLSATALAALGAGALVGVPLGLAAWGVNRTLGKSPAFSLGMEAAGYVNPFTAARNTREIATLMEKWERLKTKTATGIAETVNEQIGYWRHVIGSMNRPENTPTSIGGFIRAMKAGGENYATDKELDATMGEMRMRYQMSKPMMEGIMPASDMARMGLYTTANEGNAMRSGRVWQQELIDALQRFSASSEQRLRTAQAGGSTPASLSHTH